MEALNTISSQVMRDILANWLTARGDRRSVDEYIADGRAGRLTDDDRTPYENVGEYL